MRSFGKIPELSPEKVWYEVLPLWGEGGSEWKEA